MKCPQCSSQMRKINGRYQYRESGLDNVWLENWPMFVCGECGQELPLLPNAEEAVKLVTRSLVRQAGRLDGDAVLFLRKGIGLTSVELSHLLKVTRATISRWENNANPIDGLCDLRLRLEAVDRLFSPQERKRLAGELLALFQHEYNGDIRISSKEIAVSPVNNEEDLELQSA
jgi:YgiT-type zinc finger domain-containing protein